MSHPLPDISEVRPVGPEDDVCIAEVREVLEKHGALKRFGIALLHQHFQMGPEETLVESIDVERRILTSTPRKVSDAASGAIETMWRLDDSSGTRRCEVLCEIDRDADGKPYHAKNHYTTS